MIYTVTFNPSIDYIVGVDNFTAGALNRTTSEVMNPGGKGINVSIVLSNFGLETTALGFVAGFTGEEIKRLLSEKNIKSEFVDVSNGCSRINIKVRGERETEINGRGPDITDEDMTAFLQRLSSLKKEDFLVLAGAVSGGMSSDTYADICRVMEEKEVKVIVDTTGEQLKNTLQYHPFLIKPNIHELGDLFGVKLTDLNEVWEYSKKLQTMGATNVLVSMGGDGATLLDSEGNQYFVQAPQGEVVNTIGSGDSVVAGFITGYIETGNLETALKMGVAAGSASAFELGFCSRESMENLIKK